MLKKKNTLTLGTVHSNIFFQAVTFLEGKNQILLNLLSK